MPTADRYALNELQQAVLDVLGEDGTSVPIERDDLLERLVAIPGLDDTTGMSLGPCLAALKRRRLVGQQDKGAPWYITRQGLEYVDQEEGEEPAAAAAEPATTIVDDEPSGPLTQKEEWRPSLTEAQRREAQVGFDVPGVIDDRPYAVETGECQGGFEYPAIDERLQEGVAKDRVERPIARGLDLLLAQEDLASRHDVALQGELFEVLKGLVVRTNARRSQLPPGDPRDRELSEFAHSCLELADLVATSLIVPGHAPGEVAA